MGHKAHYNRTSAKDIDNAKDQSSNTTNGVAIDHRVDIQRSTPAIISLRRETFLDSHFEVRPIRIRKSDASDPDWNGKELAVKVEIIQADITGASSKSKADWIGLERSYGDSVPKNDGYCNSTTNKSANGKRLYFTTDLTTVELASSAENVLIGDNGYSQKGGQFVIVPVTTDGECVWIYVDECDEDIPSDLARSEASFDKQATRKATIRITNGYLDGNAKEFKPLNENVYEDYILCQHKLFKIQSENDLNGNGSDTDDYYYIEHEEEYLYNFDAEDTYAQNQTQFEGMPWGLPGAQLSFDNRSAYVTDEGGFIQGLTTNANRVIDRYSPFYDFYLEEDVREDLKETITFRNFAGYTFTAEIIADINNNGRDTNTED